MDFKMKKRGQVTIFIVIGVVLIGATIMFFLLRNQEIIETTGKSEENIESFLDSCLKDKIKNAIDDISIHGGYIDKEFSLNFQFQNEEPMNITYLCYTQNYYALCVNQKPGFVQDLKSELKNYISNDVQNCFDEMTKNFARKGYSIKTNYKGFSVDLLPKRVIVQTDSDISLTISGETTKDEDFKMVIASRFYEIVNLVQELVNEEAEFCYTENLGINLVYPEFIVDKFKTQGTIVYTVEHTESKEKFRFAVRGCVIPPGF